MDTLSVNLGKNMIKSKNRSREKMNESQSVMSVITKGTKGGVSNANPFNQKKNSSTNKVLA